MRIKQVLYFLTMLAIVQSIPTRALALSDTIGINTAILSVRQMNSDAYADTIIGQQLVLRSTRLSKSPYKATEIHWGYNPSTSSPFISYFKYPDWSSLKTSTAITRLNNDNSYDILVTMSGKALISSVLTPKATMVAVFGCDDLSAADTIYLASIDSLQTIPHRSTKLRKGIELTEAALRDFSSILSYRLINVDVPIDSLSAMVRTTDVNDQSLPSPTFIVYPNPAVRHAIIDGNNITPGDYKLRLLSSVGQTVQESSLHVGYYGKFTEQFNLDLLLSGRYILQLIDAKGIYQSHVLIILD